MNKYACFYKNKQIEVEAPTSYAAQQEAARRFKARKSYDITVLLVEKASDPGVQVVHAPMF